jgi:small-conductance mechanosensitive channel
MNLDKWISVGITLLVMVLVVLLINRFFKQVTKRVPGMHINFLKSVLTAVTVVIGIYTCLGQFELAREISSSLLRSGTLIIAVATFAAQKALGNVISGFTLSSARPCNIGDFIVVRQGSSVLAEGTVTDMTIRHVVIRRADGQRIIIPNSVLDDSVIINANMEASVGQMIEIEVGYDTDVEQAKKIVLDVIEKESLVIEKNRSDVMVSTLTANGMILKFGVWAKNTGDSFRACSRIRTELVKRFAEEGITIPYQTITIEKTEQ